ncbi:MAG: collagenase, partial [Colwellia sp.]|nr:collagenase [Colwellia sp.]
MMNSKNTFFFALMTSFAISACSHSPSSESPSLNEEKLPPQVVQQPALQTSGVQSILAADVESLWSEEFDHYQKDLLLHVSQAITTLAKAGNLADKDLDKLSFYFRVYSSFGPDENWSVGTAQAVNNALLALQAMPGFYQITPATAALHENYAVALYRLYFLESLQLHNVDHIQPLAQLIDLYATSDLSVVDGQQDIEYAFWEIIRASAILPYEATRKNKKAHLAIYASEATLSNALLALIGSKNAVINGDDWPKQHALWALAQYYNVYSKQYW